MELKVTAESLGTLQGRQAELWKALALAQCQPSGVFAYREMLQAQSIGEAACWLCACETSPLTCLCQ